MGGRRARRITVEAKLPKDSNPGSGRSWSSFGLLVQSCSMITPVKPTAEGCWEGQEITNENILCKLSLKSHMAIRYYDSMGN